MIIVVAFSPEKPPHDICVKRFVICFMFSVSPDMSTDCDPWNEVEDEHCSHNVTIEQKLNVYYTKDYDVSKQ